MTLLKNFATVGMATMTSRVLGFIRDVFMATMLGTGPVADAFIVAFRLPNLFRRLFAEGAFSAAFVPLFARALQEGARRAPVSLPKRSSPSSSWPSRRSPSLPNSPRRSSSMRSRRGSPPIRRSSPMRNS